MQNINLDSAISSNLEFVALAAQEIRKDAEYYKQRAEISPAQQKDILLATACGLVADYQLDKALSVLQRYKTLPVTERAQYSNEEDNTLDNAIEDGLKEIKTAYQKIMYAAVMTRRQVKVTPDQEKMLRLTHVIGYLVEKKIPEAEKTIKELYTMQEVRSLNESRQFMRMRQVAFKK